MKMRNKNCGWNCAYVLLLHENTCKLASYYSYYIFIVWYICTNDDSLTRTRPEALAVAITSRMNQIVRLFLSGKRELSGGEF